MSAPRGLKDLSTVSMPYPTATHYRHAHVILEGASETRVLDGRAIGGPRVRPLACFLDMYPGTKQEKDGEMVEKTFQRGGKSVVFISLATSMQYSVQLQCLESNPTTESNVHSQPRIVVTSKI
jgi:hypothetical protein